MTDRYQALRDAIAAGPTPGRRVVRGRIYKHGETVRVETEAGYQIADVIDAPDGDAAQNAANLALIREADPDTLFFNRRLVVEGDTEIALLVKNTLDAIDWPRLDPEALHPVRLLSALRLRLGPSNR